MRKLYLFMVAHFVIVIALTAQVTQEQADAIVLERMSQETRPYELFAKEGLQPSGTLIKISEEEIIEINYESWIYYVRYADVNFSQSSYLIVKESNLNLIEINAKNDNEPDDLQEWNNLTVYPIDIPFIDYLEELDENGTWCWTNYIGKELLIINSIEEMNNYFFCINNDSLPFIDFKKNSMFLVSSGTPTLVWEVSKKVVQLSSKKYELTINVFLTDATAPGRWTAAVVTKKICQECEIELNIK